MKIYSSDQMKNIDFETIKKYIPGNILMEHAGIETVRIIEKKIQNLSEKKVIVLAGAGNNGGDSFVVARGLSSKVSKLDIYFIGEEEKLSEDSRLNYNICKKLNLNFIKNFEELMELNEKFKYDIIIDGIFGIGLNRNVIGEHYNLISFVNNLKNKFVISLDIPSGVNSNTGEIQKIGINADLTIAYHGGKLGHFLYPGREYRGKLSIVDIGIPNIVESEDDLDDIYEIIKKEDIKFKIRNKNIHKGNAGKVVCIGGKTGFSGAIYMASEAALNSGSGLVYSIIPKGINTILEQKSTETITVPIGDEKREYFRAIDYVETINFINEIKPDVIILGPGIGREEETINYILKLLNEINDINIVLDADGLYAIKDDLAILYGKNIIMTPHMGEFKRIIKSDIKNKLEKAKLFSENYGVITVLKGADTIISNGKKTYINLTGNPGMATAGTGDVLAGIIASFVGQGYNRLEASKISVFLHGYIGDKIAEYESEEGVTANKIIKKIGECIKDIKK
ncbi:NAD(P)H-hydrate dehydratase [Haliovirga abyssi]|uniref:Bifunctional NAD(P)H-hydrate repair enzyme n=1 Tax=Haliovirga abyssi TaxID=2996794 RepID=A0AAU9D6J5_9FUSO|nr:NAD(P)H-hydrate dehydratase [Haliovirga abyssi]BDU50163.1 bifunctional NAD(P)H-hydrate repair enzyme Nnr [Haliovirga abyssi]